MVLWSRLNKLKKIQWGTILNYQKRKLLIETINEIQKKGWKKLYNDVTLKKVLIIMYNFHQNQSLSSWRVPLILKLSKKYIQHKRFSTHIDKKKQKKHIKQLEGATMLAGYNIQNLSSLEVEPQDTMKRAARIIYYFCRQIEDIEKEKHLLCRNKRKRDTCSRM